MHLHLPIIADNDELIATFQQVIATAPYFGEKGFATDFMFNIPHSTAHDATACSSFCPENGAAPSWVLNGRAEHLHGPVLPYQR